MIPFLIFYYIFSVFFMVGYCNFDVLESWKEIMWGIFVLIIIAPIALPVNLGVYIYNNTN